jgi:lipopolysaccharide/colanic/teichoic acid biosynthesis glycosyltransferase
MDIGLCLLALPLVLPLLAIIGVLIHLESPGPAFFTQERVGKRGRRFRMYKIRTMQHNLEDPSHGEFMRAFVRGQIAGTGKDEAVYKPHKASQVTRLGHFLRRSSLDEVPQVFNVLKGEMSLVGPRPNIPLEVEAYQPWHMARLAVLPGITGLAQVRGRSCITFDDIVRYDIEYIETQRPVLDLKILWWTAMAVVSGKGTG